MEISFYLEHGGQLAREIVPSPGEAVASGKAIAIDAAIHYDFSLPELHMDFQWLRTPYPERLFRLEDNALMLMGRESIGSWFEQSLLARRQQHHSYSADTRLEFSPVTYQQAAGLTTYYNRFDILLSLKEEDSYGAQAIA